MRRKLAGKGGAPGTGLPGCVASLRARGARADSSYVDAPQGGARNFLKLG